MARPKPTAEMKAQYVALVSSGMSLGDAAKGVGRSIEAVGRWVKFDPALGEALKAARIEGKRAKRIRQAQRARGLVAALSGAPAPTPMPATLAGESLPHVRPIACGVVRDGVVFLDAGQLAKVLAAARIAS